MYIEAVPNRDSPPCVLLRESYRQDGKVRKRTLANLSKLPPETIEALKCFLRGGTTIENLPDAFEVTRTQPYGHIAAVLGTLRDLKLDQILGPPCRERNLVLAMIVDRIVSPCSKLATARALGEDAQLGALNEALKLGQVDEDQLYDAMDWLDQRQAEVEKTLAERHLEEESLVLYDLTSTYFEGRCCPLAHLGYSRDGKKKKLQIVFGLLCDHRGCPIAVEVFDGNTADSETLKPQIKKLRQRFGLERVVLVGDRGMITSTKIDQELRDVDGLDWVSALRSTQIRKLLSQSPMQMSLFDERGFVEITDPEMYPGERLIVCRNPLLADERAYKREELLKATERELDVIVRATRRRKQRLTGKDNIGLRVGRVINRFKVAKHFILEIGEDHFSYRRDEERIAEEAAVDGFYVIRTSVPEQRLSAERAIEVYKSLSAVERAFRSYKTVDLHVRPIYHFLSERVRSHVFLCMLAYYVEWHMRQKLAPLLFDDEDKEGAKTSRESVVKPARRSPSARRKATSRLTADGLPVHSFQTLLAELATFSKIRVQPKLSTTPPFEKLGILNPIQQRAFGLLGISPSLCCTQ